MWLESWFANCDLNIITSKSKPRVHKSSAFSSMSIYLPKHLKHRPWKRTSAHGQGLFPPNFCIKLKSPRSIFSHRPSLANSSNAENQINGLTAVPTGPKMVFTTLMPHSGRVLFDGLESSVSGGMWLFQSVSADVPLAFSLQWFERKSWARSLWEMDLLERCATQSSRWRWAGGLLSVTKSLSALKEK